MPRRALAVLLFALALAPLAAPAQLFRAYLSIDGSDANPCTLPQPCRLLPAALAAVASGGEIWMLDSANYNTGMVQILKSVRILAVPGALGSLVAAGDDAIHIGTAGLRVTLRNLNFRPLAGSESASGLLAGSATSVTIEGCNFTGFTSGTAMSVSGSLAVSVLDSVFEANGVGLSLGNGVTATVIRSHFIGSSNGLVARNNNASVQTYVTVGQSVFANNDFGVIANAQGATTRLSVDNSVIASNSAFGAAAYTLDAGGTAYASVVNSSVTGNGSGLVAGGVGSNARMVASGNLVAQNNYGLVQESGSLQSAGNNIMQGNNLDTSGTITPATAL